MGPDGELPEAVKLEEVETGEFETDYDGAEGGEEAEYEAAEHGVGDYDFVVF
jgi:hypothetical protein